MKKTSLWRPVLNRYVTIVTTGNLPAEEEVEFLDEQPTVPFNIENEDGELA